MQAQGSISTSGVNAVTLTGDAFTRTFTPNAAGAGLVPVLHPGRLDCLLRPGLRPGQQRDHLPGRRARCTSRSEPVPEVRSNPTDLLEPTVSAFRFSPASIDVSSAPATVSVEFDVADELSGVQAAWLTFRSPTIAASPYIQRTATFYEDMTYPRITTQKTVRAQVTFPRYDRGGDSDCC